MSPSTKTTSSDPSPLLPPTPHPRPISTDDNLAVKEKIGSANYVWSFPSDAYKKAKLKHDSNTTQVEDLSAQVTTKETKKAALEEGREQTTEYTTMYDELKAKRKELSVLDQDAAANAANDPAVLAELAEAIETMRTNINRVTDNTFELLSFCVNKKNMDKKEVKNFLGISESYDNV